jgi:hypothetical protein
MIARNGQPKLHRAVGPVVRIGADGKEADFEQASRRMVELSGQHLLKGNRLFPIMDGDCGVGVIANRI